MLAHQAEEEEWEDEEEEPEVVPRETPEVIVNKADKLGFLKRRAGRPRTKKETALEIILKGD